MKKTYRNTLILLPAMLVMFVVFLFVCVVSRTPKTLSDKAFYSAKLGGDYLVRHLKENGKFDYLYNPETDKVEKGYNMLRHAGTVYALLNIYDATDDKKYLQASEKAIDYLLQKMDECPGDFSNFQCLHEGGRVKLGGNALSVLALSEYMLATNDKKYFEEAKSLASWILATQTEDGEFSIHSQTEDGEVEGLISEYYPGEAVYALMKFYDVSKDEKYLNGAKKGVEWIINVRDKGKTYKNINHDHWLLYGLRELYRHEPSEEYVKHAKTIVDAIVNLQHVSNGKTEPSWVGGFYSPPRSTPTATRSEALVCAHDIFTKASEKEYVDLTDKTLKSGVIFELRTFIDGPTARKYPNPVMSLGGFKKSLTDSTVRIDYVQHNISALLGYWRISEK